MVERYLWSLLTSLIMSSPTTLWESIKRQAPNHMLFIDCKFARVSLCFVPRMIYPLVMMGIKWLQFA